MSTQPTLFDTLQREFCPPLDSSLLAALLADFESDGRGNELVPSEHQIDELRGTLRELSSQADVDESQSQLSEFADLRLASQTDDNDNDTSSTSTPDFYHGNTATSSSRTSDSSESSHHSFSSPLGFLQAALPHVSIGTLSSALQNQNGGAEDGGDMWDIVAGILTAESIRELEERGLDASEEGLDDMLREDEIDWETVERKNKGLGKAKVGKRRSVRGKTIALVDVRQQQHLQYVPKRSNTNGTRCVPAPDPWTQLTSLSSHLATLVPPHAPSFFQSYFHSPEYATPYIALHACLKLICSSLPPLSPEEYTDTLFILLDILFPEYGDLDAEDQSRLVSDIEVALQVTRGGGDGALDLVKLLRDLDSDSTGFLEMGVYHFAAAPQTTQTEAPTRPPLPSGPPQIQPPPQPKPKTPPSPPSKPPSCGWQSVPQRRTPNNGAHPLSSYIPAYARDTTRRTGNGAGNAFGQGGKGDVGELRERRRRMGESVRRRNELLRQATRMWQQGNSRTRGGEVAFYFAERAREFQELARTEALNAARVMVESKRLASSTQCEVDLHGTTVSEAIIIVKEILAAQDTSPSKPLKIITGRGSHSANQVSVLKPAIKKALVQDGWVVGGWDGGLVVRGKR
ncbi:hypothetical protein FPV67DRAFT_1777505 [Lyophyllum atratum]|nr:hypothetical protein FPV67DRAFT_1777505 [Lyophyllum atratum]